MPRPRSNKVRISLHFVLDPVLDAPLLEELARTPRGLRADLVRRLLRQSYAALTAGEVAVREEDPYAWVDALASEEDAL